MKKFKSRKKRKRLYIEKYNNLRNEVVSSVDNWLFFQMHKSIIKQHKK